MKVIVAFKAGSADGDAADAALGVVDDAAPSHGTAHAGAVVVPAGVPVTPRKPLDAPGLPFVGDAAPAAGAAGATTTTTGQDIPGLAKRLTTGQRSSIARSVALSMRPPQAGGGGGVSAGGAGGSGGGRPQSWAARDASPGLRDDDKHWFPAGWHWRTRDACMVLAAGLYAAMVYVTWLFFDAMDVPSFIPYGSRLASVSARALCCGSSSSPLQQLLVREWPLRQHRLPVTVASTGGLQMMVSNVGIGPLILLGMAQDLTNFCHGNVDPFAGLPATVTAHGGSGGGSGSGSGMDPLSKLQALQRGSGCGSSRPASSTVGGGSGSHSQKPSWASAASERTLSIAGNGGVGGGGVDAAPLLSEHRAMAASARLSASLLPAHAARMQASRVRVTPSAVAWHFGRGLGGACLSMFVYQLLFSIPSLVFLTILTRVVVWPPDKASTVNTVLNVCFFMVLVPLGRRVYACYAASREASMREKEVVEERLSVTIGEGVDDDAVERLIPRSPSRVDIDVDAPLA